MKLKSMLTFFPALALLGACAEEIVSEEQEPVSPEVTYSTDGKELAEGAKLEVYANSPVRLEATVRTPGPVECAWYVTDDDVESKVASTPVVTYVFPEVGEYGIRFEAFNEAGSTGGSWTVNASGIPLEVTFDVEGETIESMVGETLAVNVTVTGGGEGLTTTWTLTGEDGVPETISTSESLSYRLSAPGTYTLTYLGVNTYNISVTESWTVEVADLPLDVDFSMAGDAFSCTVGFPVSITATPVTGTEGVTHSWKVDGADAGTDAVLEHTFTTAGEHVIEYLAKNAIDEEFTYKWTVTVMEYMTGTMFLDFEGKTELPDNLTDSQDKTNNSHISLVDNPYETDINDSAKVIKADKSSNTSGTSGFYNIRNLPSENLASYTTLRMKVYIGAAPYYPPIRLFPENGQVDIYPCRINGMEFDNSAPSKDAWKALIYTDDWNVLEYDIRDGGLDSFEGIDQIQPRPFTVDFNASQSTGATDPVTNPRIMYYDDFEFLP